MSSLLPILGSPKVVTFGFHFRALKSSEARAAIAPPREWPTIVSWYFGYAFIAASKWGRVSARVCFQDVMKPRWTLQLVHLGGLLSSSSEERGESFEPNTDSSRVVEPSSSSPGYGTYSWGIVDKSTMVFATEYVPRKATMMRGSEGGWEMAM